MTVDEFHVRAKPLENLAENGEKIVKALGDFIERITKENRSAYPRILERTKYRLTVSVYGFLVIFRIELRLNGSTAEGFLAVYTPKLASEPESAPAEKPFDLRYKFNTTGLVARLDKNGKQTREELTTTDRTRNFFAQTVVADVLTKLTENAEIFFRPELEEQQQ
jgi:hypothetical protein